MIQHFIISSPKPILKHENSHCVQISYFALHFHSKDYYMCQHLKEFHCHKTLYSDIFKTALSELFGQKNKADKLLLACLMI